MPRPRKSRSDYAHFQQMATRWRDNDVYHHLNNAVYLEYVETCVNGWLASSGALDVPSGPVVGLVVETACVFHESISFPDTVETGLRVSRIGNSSVQYEIGLFRGDAEHAAAEARFVHVYVDSGSRRPRPLDDTFRAALETLRLR